MRRLVALPSVTMECVRLESVALTLMSRRRTAQGGTPLPQKRRWLLGENGKRLLGENNKPFMI